MPTEDGKFLEITKPGKGWEWGGGLSRVSCHTVPSSKQPFSPRKPISEICRSVVNPGGLQSPPGDWQHQYTGQSSPPQTTGRELIDLDFSSMLLCLLLILLLHSAT